MIFKAELKRSRVERAILAGKKPKMASRAYNCCQKCGRTRAYFRFFGLCRICLREFARKGVVTGLRKSSW